MKLRLSALLEKAGLQTGLSSDPWVLGLAQDSRKVRKGELFAALPPAAGGSDRSAAHLLQAKASGAVAALVRAGQGGPAGLPLVRVADPRLAFSLLCAAWHGWPSRALKVCGVTGTNGKTTTTFLLAGISRAAGAKPALIGTVGTWLGEQHRESLNTTPGALELQATFGAALQSGCRSAVMEVSSHALDQGRVAGTAFDAAVFTNLTRDHLDYHGSMAAYRSAKARLFGSLGLSGKTAPVAVLNMEDAAWRSMRAACGPKVRVLRYGVEAAHAEVQALSPRLGVDGTRFKLLLPGHKPVALRFPMPGRFNLMNALAAAGAAQGLGFGIGEIVAGLEAPRLPPGRFETVAAGQDFGVVVDYAHTPDALERVLTAGREVTRGRLIVVFGCGGDRDPGKRPQMGAIAHRKADLVVLTSDNPRSEDPESILAQIRSGIHEPRGSVRRTLCLPDRAAAIRRALKLAKRGDLVLIAGKGHETTQILGQTKLPFDDRQVAREALRELGRC